MSEGYREFGLLQRREGVASGQACLRDSGIMVQFIAGRFAAGEDVDELAKDYGRSRTEIEAALRLVIVARGNNLNEKRARRIVDAVLPMLHLRRSTTGNGHAADLGTDTSRSGVDGIVRGPTQSASTICVPPQETEK